MSRKFACLGVAEGHLSVRKNPRRLSQDPFVTGTKADCILDGTGHPLPARHGHHRVSYVTIQDSALNEEASNRNHAMKAMLKGGPS